MSKPTTQHSSALKQNRKFDLTNGPIFRGMLTLSIPIMLTGLVQTLQNLVGAFWMSRLGEQYVLGVGLAMQFTWLCMGFMIACRIGSEIGVSQSVGKNDFESAQDFARNGLVLAFFLGVFLAITTFVFRHQFLSIFPNEGNEYALSAAVQYLEIAVIAIPFMFVHFLITGVYGGFGNTRLPFYINVGAIVANIVLTPFFVFTLDMGIRGAALSLVVVNIGNCLVKIWAMTIYRNRPFQRFRLFGRIQREKINQIISWSAPMAVEQVGFTLLFMGVSIIILDFGTGPGAVQTLGVQIESMVFMVASGFSSALVAFVGQNYGAKKWDRLNRSRKLAFRMMFAYGVFSAIFLFIFAEPLMRMFLDDMEYLSLGVDYLRILAACQVLFCMDAVALAFFRGRGKVLPPMTVILGSGGLRVFLAWSLSMPLGLGVTGIWIAKAITMTVRSITLLVWGMVSWKKEKYKFDMIENEQQEGTA